ncbi:uncharacterized protein Fot_08508 [Forsythia ovata]|uniref:GRF-type domain-containing protein n=1 Tax=Forsythia ovata TaxID=205694 RepID=A0ABD1WYZ8_9LAMI
MEDSHSLQKLNRKLCYCGHIPVMKTSWTESNPGRRFWGCRFYGKDDACDFFDWADPTVHDRYKLVINGLLRKKNEGEKEKEKLSKTMRMYRLFFSLVVLYFVVRVVF